jgi:ABC-2 type transport system permease protein
MSSEKIERIRNLRFNPFITLFWKEIRRYMKVSVQTVLTPAINSALYLIIFGVSLGSSIDTGYDIPYLAFLISGLVMMGCLNNSFQNTASSIVSGKFSGDLEDLKVVPLGTQQIIWAMSLGGITRGLMVSSVNLGVGQLFYYSYYKEFFDIQSPGLLVFFLVVGALVYAKLGIFVAFLSKSFDQMSAVTAFVLQPLSFLGGVFFSLNNLSPFWQEVSLYNPVLYFINGVRLSTLGASDVSLNSAIVVSLISLVLSHLLALFILRKSQFKRW